VRKRQQVLTLSGGNRKRKGTDTARLLFEITDEVVRRYDASKAAAAPVKE